ncbi:MAG TPA: ABC transporter permease [Thermoanaerobaculia bacterium]|nr:ABC transporter permease [Thermoanaerobaculia bacterium]
MSLARDVAWRYLRRPADRLISAVGLASILGLVIGVMALVISMALMTGYREDLQHKLLGGNAELFIYAPDQGIADIESVIRDLEAMPAIQEASPVLFQPSLVASEAHTTGEQVMLKGIDPSRAKTSPMLRKLVGPTSGFKAGDGSPGVAVGKYLASRMGLERGSPISVTVPRIDGESALPQSGSFAVTNVYDTGFYEFDARWIFMDLQDVRELLGAGELANLVEVKLETGADLDQAAAAVRRAVGDRYAVTDWRQMNRQLFSLLRIQQLVLFIVIGLIVFVSTFNIVSTLIMTVHEKRREIGILVAMGGEKQLIRRIFLWYGTMVGIAGTASGLLLGSLTSWILTRFELISFGPEIAQVYFISSIPFVIDPGDLAVIAGFSITVCFLATVVPSLRAARLQPVDALRHE